MKIFMKFIFRSMLEKKARMGLLIGSIGISIALLVGTLSASETLSNMLYDQMHGIYGDYNIQISARSDTEKFLFDLSCLDNIKYKESFKSIMINAEYSDNIINYVGTTSDDFENLDNISILEGDQDSIFIDDGILISKETSDSLGLKLGDRVKINLLGNDTEFTISAICSDTGLFSYDTEDNFTVFGNYEKILDMYNITDEMYSNILLSVETDDIDNWIEEFNEKNINENICASLTIDENSVNGQLDWLQLTLYFMLGIIVVMTIFIISSTFKLIITERLSVIGTFLSQGSSIFKIIKLLLIESCFYGIIGGLIGCSCGVVATKIITDFANPLGKYGIDVGINLNPVYFIVSFVFAILMSMISAYIPVMGIKKLQIKEIILNIGINKKEKSKAKVYIGIVFLCLTVLILLIDKKIDYLGSIPSLIFFFISIMCLMPIITEKVLGIIEKIKNLNPIIKLAINNVKTSVLLKSTINLISICIIAIIMMISLGNSIKFAINTAYSHMYYDVNVSMQSKNYEEVENILNELKDEGEIDNIISISNVEASLNGEASKKIDIYCIDADEYMNFEDYMYYDNKVQQLKEIDNNIDGIIISKMIANNYGIKEGDKIQLTTENKKVEFKVLSIVDARMFADGNYNIISKEAAKKYFDVSYSSNYYLVSDKNDMEFLSNIKEKLKGLGTLVLSKEELIKNQEDEISQLINILNFITVLTILIGAISCMSNISINFLQRSKEFAVLNSIGLTVNKGMGMLVVENIIQAILACIFAFLSSLIINKLFVGIYIFLGMDLQFVFPSKYIVVITLSVLAIVFLVSISTIIKSRKINIIKEIKYE